MARAVALLIVLLFAGCAPADGPCLAWCKNYIHAHTSYTATDECWTLPCIAVIEQGDVAHAIVVTRIDDGVCHYVDNGYIGGRGTVLKSEITYWLRRYP